MEADDSTKKSLQNTNQDVKQQYDCSMNEIDSKRRRLQIAESLMFLDIYLHDNFVMMPKERPQDFLERYYSFARQKSERFNLLVTILNRNPSKNKIFGNHVRNSVFFSRQEIWMSNIIDGKAIAKQPIKDFERSVKAKEYNPISL